MAIKEYSAGNNGRRPGTAILTVRRRQLVFSKEFMTQYKLLDCHSMKISVDEEALSLHFAFLLEPEPGCFLLGFDGGQAYSRKRSSDVEKMLPATRVVECSALIRDVGFLSTISRQSKPERQFVITKVVGKVRNFLVCLPPTFGKPISRYNAKEIDREVVGLYCYILKGKIVYIGRGNIRGRLAAPERQDWAFDEIAFVAVDGETAQIKWERYHLDKHIEINGQKPSLNRINGFWRDDD